MVLVQSICLTQSGLRTVCVSQPDSTATWLVPLLAAFVGALIGAIALGIVHRADSRARRTDRELERQSRFDAALARLMESMYAQAASIPNDVNMAVRGAPRGDAQECVARLQVARVAASESEDAVLAALSGPLEMGIGTPDQERANLRAWAAELLLWRRGIITDDKAIEDFAAVWRTFLVELLAAGLAGKASAAGREDVDGVELDGSGDLMGDLKITELVRNRANQILQRGQ